jgi:hypothetical protein
MRQLGGLSGWQSRPDCLTRRYGIGYLGRNPSFSAPFVPLRRSRTSFMGERSSYSTGFTGAFSSGSSGNRVKTTRAELISLAPPFANSGSFAGGGGELR